MKRFFLATISIALLLTGCYKDDIKKMHDEIDSLKDAQLTELSEQAVQIEASISTLNEMSASLQQYVDALDKSKAAVEEKVSGITISVSELRNSSEEDINGYLTDFISKIEDLDDALITEIRTADSVIATLGTDGDSIQQKIDDLESYLEENFAGKDWATGTFGTLEVQNAIIEDIEDIKYHIKALNASAEELHQMLKDQISEAVADFRAKFTGKIAEEADKITKAYTQAIADMETAVNNDIAGRLEKAIDKSESSVMSWVNEQLNDYLKASEAEAMVNTCMNLLGIVPGGKTLQAELSDAQDSLSRAKEEVVAAYKSAISEAIKNHNGVISEKIDKQIQDLRSNVIAPVTNRIEPLRKEVEELWKAVGELDIRIKTAEGQREAISTSLGILSKLNMTLEEYVTAVKTELENTDKANAETLQGLIAALDAILNGQDDSSLPSQLAALKAYVGTVPDGNADLSSWIQTTFGTLDAQFSSYATTEKVNSIIDALKAALGSQDSQIQGLENRLDNLLASSKATIQGWINTKLESYYTAAEIEGLLNGLDGEIKTYFTDGDKELQKQIDTISAELARQKTTLEQAYKDAISKAINEQKGIIDTRIKNEFKPVDDSIATLQGKSSGLKTRAGELREELNGYYKNVEAIESAIDSLQKFLSVKEYKSLLEFVTDAKKKIGDFKGVFADKAEFDQVKNYVNGSLKTEIDKIQPLVDRLEKVKSTIQKIDAFLSGFGTSDGNLKTQLGKIKSDYEAIRKTADEQGLSVGSLLGKLSTVDAALSEIEGIIDNYLGYIIKDNLKSISYVPQYLDQKQTVICDGTTATSTFRFLLKPAEVVELAAEQEGCLTMKFKPYGGALTDFEIQTIDSYDKTDGSVVITVSETKNYSKLINGSDGSAAVLFYDCMVEGEDGKDHLVEFTSKFIPLYIQYK